MTAGGSRIFPSARSSAHRGDCSASSAARSCRHTTDESDGAGAGDADERDRDAQISVPKHSSDRQRSVEDVGIGRLTVGAAGIVHGRRDTPWNGRLGRPFILFGCRPSARSQPKTKDDRAYPDAPHTRSPCGPARSVAAGRLSHLAATSFRSLGLFMLRSLRALRASLLTRSLTCPLLLLELVFLLELIFELVFGL